MECRYLSTAIDELASAEANQVLRTPNLKGALTRAASVVAVALCLPIVAISSTKAGDCDCPTISAKGKGETSCSANESANVCTINYNLFTIETEQRAASFVQEVSRVNVSLPSPGIPASQQLRAASDQSGAPLAGLVATYLIIAALDQASRQPGSVDMSQLRRAVALITSEPIREAIQASFGQPSFGRWAPMRADQVPRSPAQLAELSRSFFDRSVRVGPGCVEYRTRIAWMMFKAAWSPYRFSPRCGE